MTAMTDREAATLLERVGLGDDAAKAARTVDRLIARAHPHAGKIAQSARYAVRVSGIGAQVEAAIAQLGIPVPPASTTIAHGGPRRGEGIEVTSHEYRELERLRGMRTGLRAYCDTVAAVAAEPPCVPPPAWLVKIRELLAAAG